MSDIMRESVQGTGALSDIMRESAQGTGAFKRKISLCVVFGFEHLMSENSVIRRRVQLTRGHIDIEEASEILWTCASDNRFRAAEAGEFVVNSFLNRKPVQRL